MKSFSTLLTFLLLQGVFVSPLFTVRADTLTEKREKLSEITQTIKLLEFDIIASDKTVRSASELITQLSLEIEKTQGEIELAQKELTRIQGEIMEVKKEITSTETRIQHEKAVLAGFMRELYLFERRPLTYLILGEDTVSGFFKPIGETRSIQNEVHASLTRIQDFKEELTQKRRLLERGELEQSGIARRLMDEEAQLDEQRTSQEALLAQTRSRKTSLKAAVVQARDFYRDLVSEIAALAKSEFEKSLPWEEAISLAKRAGEATGVRPALIAAIVHQESRLGRFTGSGRYKTDMAPSQWASFLRITEGLGLNPDETPVSAKPKSYPGWGGAMGPAQIMPNNWTRIAPEIAELSNKTIVSPWDIGDAFFGAAMMLKRMGAAEGDFGAERAAAGRYFAGGNWEDPAFVWYADRAMEVAERVERDFATQLVS
ncbi:MAG: lytic murein transglycosylase [Parcubacteria group bacterium]|nr:lytic murein transglycosylase [Parcubacteria group bacterium]